MSVASSIDTIRSPRQLRLVAAFAVSASIVLSGCASKPLLPYSEDPPLVLLPASKVGIDDRRGRFREIFCAVLEQGRATLPDYLPCTEALVRLGAEPEGSGRPVDLGATGRRLRPVMVPGLGWDCFAPWLDMKDTVFDHVRQFGYDPLLLKVDALSSTGNNARQIRDAIMAMETDEKDPGIVLIGYSKGVPDILESLVSYPELRPRVAAVVSVAGAVGGSPLAYDTTQSELNLMRYWPGAECTVGDDGAIESLQSSTRRNWLAANPLPPGLPYYSLVSYPKPERISSALQSSYDKLALVDPRNDGQLISYDQVIPGSGLLGYINADHWAVSVPVARAHQTIGSVFVDQNNFPREALLEALLRFVEEDLSASAYRAP
jgi:hypothetical protein